MVVARRASDGGGRDPAAQRGSPHQLKTTRVREKSHPSTLPPFRAMRKSGREDDQITAK
jgi:hypothetical protein